MGAMSHEPCAGGGGSEDCCWVSIWLLADFRAVLSFKPGGSLGTLKPVHGIFGVGEMKKKTTHAGALVFKEVLRPLFSPQKPSSRGTWNPGKGIPPKAHRFNGLENASPRHFRSWGKCKKNLQSREVSEWTSDGYGSFVACPGNCFTKLGSPSCMLLGNRKKETTYREGC